MKTLFVFTAALLMLGSGSPRIDAAMTSAAAAAESAQGRAAAPGQQKKYRATRPIVSDRQTGQWRMPTVEEVAEVIDNLSTLTNRSTEGLQQVQVQTNAVAVDLQGGFGGVVLARPSEDGTLETRCVFTFAEAADFLGLVEEAQ